MQTLALKKIGNISPEMDSEIISLYFNKENPLSLRAVRNYYKNKGIKISVQTISNRIKNQGHILRTGSEAHIKGKILPSYDEVRERYESKGESAREIVEECGGTVYFVYKRLKEMGIETRGIGKKKIDYPKDTIIEMHRAHISEYKIADYLRKKGYKSCHATVRNRLIEWGEIKKPCLEEKVK